MRTTSIAAALAVSVLSGCSASQGTAEDAGRKRDEAPSARTWSIPLIVYAVTPVEVFLEDGRTAAKATGFYYERDRDVFLVSAAHVFRNADKPDAYKRIRVYIQEKSDGVRQWRPLVLPLYTPGGEQLWKQQDGVALLRLQLEHRDQLEMKPLSKRSLPPVGTPILPGDTVTAAGYPYGHGDFMNLNPIFRSGGLASVYPVCFGPSGQCFFLADLPAHPGMSGGPVLTRVHGDAPAPSGSAGGPSDYYLLGILEGYFKLPDGGQIAKVWYAERIEQVAESFPRDGS